MATSNRVKSLKTLFFFSAMALAISPCAGVSHAEDGVFDPGYVKIEVENVSHLGGDGYGIEIALLNRSGDTVFIKEVAVEFSVQTEVIGRWTQLEADVDFPAGGGVIASGGALSYDAVVAISLDIPRLYLNAYGDVNLRLRYRAGFAVEGEEGVFEGIGERFYWITPGTSVWVLREGM